jgi:hypothetical protein
MHSYVDKILFLQKVGVTGSDLQRDRGKFIGGDLDVDDEGFK